MIQASIINECFGTMTSHIYKKESYLFIVKRARSRLLYHVHINYAVFSPKKVQPKFNNEEKLDKSRMWNIPQSRKLDEKNFFKIRIDVIKSNVIIFLKIVFLLFQIKWSRDITN